MLKVSYDTFTKEWLLWRPSYGIISTHKTRKEAEAALAAELDRQEPAREGFRR